MKVLQLNLNHCAAAQDLLSQTIREMDIDVAIICEQYKNISHGVWEKDDTGKAAIWSCGNFAFQESMRTPVKGFVRVKIEGIYIYSCYISPNVSLTEFETYIDGLVADASNYNPKIIGGDFNAWAVNWGCKSTNARGRILLEAFAQLDLVLCNMGDAQTFRRGDTGSVVDLTFVSPTLAKELNWYVSEHYTHSDHQAIIFSVLTGTTVSTIPKEAIATSGWAQKKLDSDIFLAEFSSRVTSITNRTGYNLITDALKKACDAAMPRRRQSDKRKPNYWWNDEIAELRKKCLRARRLFQRGTSREDYNSRRQTYQLARRDLQTAIKKSKRENFKKLCREVDLNPWGNAYRIVMSSLKGRRTPQVTCPSLLGKIVEVLFPNGEPCRVNTIQVQETIIEEVTENEVLQICSSIGDSKAPGPDGIPNKALKLALMDKPQIFANVFNICLRNGEFPEVWKKQKLVLIPKPNKQLGEPSSYRPICLLDTLGKVLERIIYNRLLPAVESANGLSERQFGFRKARSTIDAINTVLNMAGTAIEGKGAHKKYCAVITLDIKNAFNSAGWNHIMLSLSNLGVPAYILKILGDYFTNRTLWYNTDVGMRCYKTTAGVPQGSVLGPLLWNVMYNKVLELNIPDEASIIGFADDIAIVIRARFLDEVEMYANDTIRIIKDWLQKTGLELADHKTEAVLISSRRKKESVNIKVGTADIRSKTSIKYLGVMIDERLNFKAHMEYACERAAAVNNTLSRIMPNVGGPRQSRRLLISRVTTSILMYGAPIWAKSIRSISRKNVLSLFRQCCLRVCSGYRTVSLDAICVIAGTIPMDLAADEACRVHAATEGNSAEDRREIKSIERNRTMEKWQRRWENTQKGRWTFRLIPVLRTWMERKHGEVNYYLTQFFSGHGGYRGYLFKYGHDDSPNCPLCMEVEDAEHVVFKCPRFDDSRHTLENEIGRVITPENMVNVMAVSEERWQLVSNYITQVHMELSIEEKRRKSGRGVLEDVAVA